MKNKYSYINLNKEKETIGFTNNLGLEINQEGFFTLHYIHCFVVPPMKLSSKNKLRVKRVNIESERTDKRYYTSNLYTN